MYVLEYLSLFYFHHYFAENEEFVQFLKQVFALKIDLKSIKRTTNNNDQVDNRKQNMTFAEWCGLKTTFRIYIRSNH